MKKIILLSICLILTAGCSFIKRDVRVSIRVNQGECRIYVKWQYLCLIAIEPPGLYAWVDQRYSLKFPLKTKDSDLTITHFEYEYVPSEGEVFIPKDFSYIDIRKLPADEKKSFRPMGTLEIKAWNPPMIERSTQNENP